jgi:hypothetical protein
LWWWWNELFVDRESGVGILKDNNWFSVRKILFSWQTMMFLNNISCLEMFSVTIQERKGELNGFLLKR